MPNGQDLAGFRPIGWSPAVLFRIPAVLAGFGALLPESGHIRRNPTNPDSDETIRIPAFISDSGYSSQNPIKVAGIPSFSDGILSLVIFILNYINIYMF
jgi:hypothetical protein